MNKQETIVDIIAEKRRVAERIRNSPSTVPVRQWDQQAEIKSLEDEANRLEAALKRESGDAAKLREALKTVKRYFDGCTVNVPEMRRQVDAALAATPRNCEVGTAEEQAERLYKFCENQPCSTCRLKRATYRECALVWAQLPCGPKKGKVAK